MDSYVVARGSRHVVDASRCTDIVCSNYKVATEGSGTVTSLPGLALHVSSTTAYNSFNNKLNVCPYLPGPLMVNIAAGRPDEYLELACIFHDLPCMGH